MNNKLANSMSGFDTRIVNRRRTSEGWNVVEDANGNTYWADDYGHYSANDADGRQYPDSECFTSLDGRIIPFTRNGTVTQEAWEAIEEKSLAFERDYRRMNGLED